MEESREIAGMEVGLGVPLEEVEEGEAEFFPNEGLGALESERLVVFWGGWLGSGNEIIPLGDKAEAGRARNGSGFGRERFKVGDGGF